MTDSQTDTTVPANRVSGIGRLLIVVYGVLALAATGRSFVQIVRAFDEAPLAYRMVFATGVMGGVATIGLVKRTVLWYRIAWVTIGFELLGVLLVGTLSLVDPALFQHATVWSVYGSGYLFIPLVLPLLGMWWLARHPVATIGSRA